MISNPIYYYRKFENPDHGILFNEGMDLMDQFARNMDVVRYNFLSGFNRTSQLLVDYIAEGRGKRK